MKENDDVAISPRDYYLVDIETWRSIVESFANDPATALHFAMVLNTIQDAIKEGKEGRAVAIASLKVGIEIAFPLTEDYEAALNLFYARISGELKAEEELPRLAKGILGRRK